MWDATASWRRSVSDPATLIVRWPPGRLGRGRNPRRNHVLMAPYYGPPMTSGPITHCAINADDLEASRRFYSALFGWTFEPFGPPGFMRTRLESGQVVALQSRRDLGGIHMTGFECTIAVPDVDAIARAVEPHGGRVLMPRARIPDVGDVVFFADPSGIAAGAMQYDRGD